MVGAEALRVVGRGGQALDRSRRPGLRRGHAPDYVPPDDATAEKALRGDAPFIMQADGKGWLFAPSG